MKILYICSADLSGESGSLGSVRHIIEVSENLCRIGNRLKLIVPKYAKYRQKTPIEIIYVPLINLRFIRSLIYETLAPIYIFIHLLFWRPDIVYWRQAYLTFFPVLLAKLFRKKIITEVNGLTIDEINSEPLSALRKWIVLAFEKFNYWYSDHLICVAPVIKKRILKHYKVSNKKITVILNGVNSNLMPVLSTKDAKKIIGIDPETAVVGFVGHFFPWDGIEFLIEAAAEIVKQRTDVTFLIIGHGRWGLHLEDLVKSKGLQKYFIFTGKVPWEDLYKYVNAFDVATAPYSMEINAQSGRSSLKILEYFACKKPVVASKTEVIPEIIDIDKKGLGITVQPENATDLASALLQILGDKNLRKEMGNGGRTYVAQNRSWRIVAEKTEAIIKGEFSRYNTKFVS